MVNRQCAHAGKLYVVKWREDLVIFVRWVAILGKMNNEQYEYRLFKLLKFINEPDISKHFSSRLLKIIQGET